MTERDLDMTTRYAAGETLDAIGKDHGVSRERVRQIVKKLGGADANHAREKRLEAGHAAHKAMLDQFVMRFRGIATDLAHKGYSRAKTVGRLKTFFPDIDALIADEALADSGIIFDKKTGDNTFSDALIVAGLWYLLGAEFSLAPDLNWAATNLDDELLEQLPVALHGSTVCEEDVATILGLIGAAQRHAIDHPEITITGSRYQELRVELVEAFGLVSEKGTAPWPPTRQTVVKRFGGWNEALLAMGVQTANRGRPKGLVQFTHAEYAQALADFDAHSTADGVATTFANYIEWAQEETASGSRRPSGASIRNVYGTWSDALRATASGHQGGEPQPDVENAAPAQSLP